jgi:hypothetical protein
VIKFLSKHIKFECIKERSLYLVVARILNSNDKLNLTCVDHMGPKDTMQWNLRFGQCNIQTLKLMQTKGILQGINTQMTQLPFCNSCLFSKQHKLKFPIDNGKKNNENFGLVRSYIWRGQYFLTFIDHYSQYTMV